MNVKQQHKLMRAIVEDTVAFYSSDPDRRRAVDMYGQCAFRTEGTISGVRHCAVGRYMTDPKKATRESYMVDPLLDRWLQPQYRGLSYTFWGHLQRIHDQRDNWGPDGITEKGKQRVQELQERIEAGIYDLDVNGGPVEYETGDQR